MKSTVITTAIGGLLALGALGATADEDRPKPEKCYGVVKAGHNDCSAGQAHGCAGLAKEDSSPAEYILLPQGTCERLVGGLLESGKPAAANSDSP